MADTQTRYTFLPYIRRGLAAAFSKDGKLASDGRIELPVQLRLNGGAKGETGTIAVPLRLYGPGDVIGIDPAEIIRTEPPHLTADFEPHYFPLVEFDTPDFPWMFTPEAADADGRLRPWLCLVVVEDNEQVGLRGDAARPLPVLDCPLGELPDLAEAWAWAHVQIVREGSDAADIAAVHKELRRVITDMPRQNLSRLLCPRRLEPNTPYIACLVPTFEAGRLAGMGEAATPESLTKPSWSNEQTAGRVSLPVYHHWRFTTGTGADSFETLVRRLERRETLPGVGRRDLDVSAPGWGVPDGQRTPLTMEGALIPAEAPGAVAEGKPDWMPEFEDAMLGLLNGSAKDAATQLVAPPIYGRHHARSDTVAKPDGEPTWLQELNLDPRFRVAAGLGAFVVRLRQEELMADAWKQVAAVERENSQRRRDQLAREVGGSLFQRFVDLPPESLLQITEPAQGAILTAGAAASGPETQTGTVQASYAGMSSVRAQVKASDLPETVLTPSFRRLLRPEGPIARRFAKAAEEKGGQVRPLRALLNSPNAAAPKPPVHNTLLPIDALAAGGAKEAAGAGKFIVQAVQSATIVSATAATKGPATEREAFRQAAAAQQASLLALSEIAWTPADRPLDISDLTAKLKAALDPAVAGNPRFEGQAALTVGASSLHAGTLPAQAGDAAITTPTFDTPMYQPLRDVHDMLLPGLENTPPNSLALLKTNPRFIEAYMVGLNHEFARELLWREYPTDQRGTYFRQFWDQRGGANDSYDLPPIHGWTSASRLGDHMSGAGQAGAGGQLVLLIRGDLLRRYPGAMIYAIKADTEGRFPASGAEVKYPRFRGGRDPDVVFIGFDLSEAEAIGDGGKGGWFFVLQEQPTAPRFGLDPTDAPLPAGELQAWRDVSWGHLAGTPEALRTMAYVPIGTALAGKSLENVTWGKNAGHMARITLQRSYRIAIHAAALLKRQTSD